MSSLLMSRTPYHARSSTAQPFRPRPHLSSPSSGRATTTRMHALREAIAWLCSGAAVSTGRSALHPAVAGWSLRRRGDQRLAGEDDAVAAGTLGGVESGV